MDGSCFWDVKIILCDKSMSFDQISKKNYKTQKSIHWADSNNILELLRKSKKPFQSRLIRKPNRQSSFKSIARVK